VTREVGEGKVSEEVGRNGSSCGLCDSWKAWDWPRAGHWEHPGTEKCGGALYAEAVRCTLLVGRQIKAEIPAKLWHQHAGGERYVPN